jgi:ATP-dependent DNA helicase RecG
MAIPVNIETDDTYSYFITTLPVHPAFLSDGGVDGGISDGVSDGVKTIDNQYDKIIKLIHDGVNDGINDGVNDLIYLLLDVSGLNASEISGRINKSIPTVERYIRLLRKKGIIEFRGIPKTGGYHLTKEAKDKLK